jgi:hypothetical protein
MKTQRLFDPSHIVAILFSRRKQTGTMSETAEPRMNDEREELQFENPFHQKVFDEAMGEQKKCLIARLREGYEIVRVDGHECIEVRRGRSWRCLTKRGRDCAP